MSHPEGSPGPFRPDNQPFVPIALPPELRDFLARTGDFACLAQATSDGTAYVIKTPSLELPNLRGTYPIGVRHELYEHPAAPVIRTVLSLHDRPGAAFKLESFVNVAEPDQWADFATLAEQERLL